MKSILKEKRIPKHLKYRIMAIKIWIGLSQFTDAETEIKTLRKLCRSLVKAAKL